MARWRLGLDLGAKSIGWAAIELNQKNEPCGLIDAGVRIFLGGRDQKFQSNAVVRRRARQMRRNLSRNKRRHTKFMNLLIKHGLMPEDKNARKELEKLDPWRLRVCGLEEQLPLHHLGRALFHLQQRRGFKSNKKVEAQLEDETAADEDGKAEKQGKNAKKKPAKESNMMKAARQFDEKWKNSGKTLAQLLAEDRFSSAGAAGADPILAELKRREQENLRGNARKKAKNRIRKYLAAQQGKEKYDGGHSRKYPLRFRPDGIGENADWGDRYPLRRMIAHEFDALWEKQAAFHNGELNNGARDELRDAMLFQRPLKAPLVGKCALTGEKRASRALPSVQRLRILQEINHLEIGFPDSESEKKLSRPQRDALVRAALENEKLTFAAARKILKKLPEGLPAESWFNMEADDRKDLKGDLTAHVLAERWGEKWRGLTLDEQDEAVMLLLDEKDGDENGGGKKKESDEEVEARQIEWLARRHGLDREKAKKIAQAPLPRGRGRYSCTASREILARLESNPEWTIYDAVEDAYPEHKKHRKFNRLPYYGEVLENHVGFPISKNPEDSEDKRFGKIANPAVHVALNQLRRVVNAVLDMMEKEHGKPQEIYVELARDLPLSKKRKEEQDKRHAANRKRNAEIRDWLAGYNESRNAAEEPTRKNLQKIKLWRELAPDHCLSRCCPYTGVPITENMLFNGEAEIDHILPYAETQDNSYNNLLLVTREGNRKKQNRAPYDSLSGGSPKYKAMVKNLPKEKKWRFLKNALADFKEKRGFLDRHLKDTQYYSRLAKQYLECLCDEPHKVLATPGRLTSGLRRTWKLNCILWTGDAKKPESGRWKNRNDHRHHAIDAVVIGVTDRKLVKRAADAAKITPNDFSKKYLAKIEEPWENFQKTVDAIIQGITVSHKPEHGVESALLEGTPMGVRGGGKKKEQSKVVHRLPLEKLAWRSLLERGGSGPHAKIHDKVVRERMKKEVERAANNAGKTPVKLSDAEFRSALNRIYPAMNKVRVEENSSVIVPEKHQSDRRPTSYKSGGNYCYDVFADKKVEDIWSSKNVWSYKPVSYFEANKRGNGGKLEFDLSAPPNMPGKRFLMRLRKQDMLAIGEGQNRRVMRVVNMTSGQISLAEHSEANTDARNRKREFKYLNARPKDLKDNKARLVRVDPAGRVFDPGPQK